MKGHQKWLRENITKIPFGLVLRLVGYFPRSRIMDEQEKICEERDVARIRENRPDSNTEPLRSLVQFVISRDILRHSPGDYYHFLVSPVPMFPFSRSLGTTRSITRSFARSTESPLFVNTETERKSGRLPIRHVSF